jgi:mRNA-degrading endonuclease RelE of RelBE toxin-antitoxin system
MNARGGEAELILSPRFARRDLGGAAMEKVRAAVLQLPSAFGGQFHNLDIEPVRQTRHKGIWRLKVPPYRVIFQVTGNRIYALDVDRRDDNTYRNIDRLVYRRADKGIALIEAPESPPRPPLARQRERLHRRSPAVVARVNPLMPFTDAQLQAMGAPGSAVSLIREMAETVDVALALADVGVAPETAELIADAWYDPARYLAIFDSGRAPAFADAQLGLEELDRRLASPDSSTSAAKADPADFERVLAAPIEDWMWFLHPLQARTVRHLPTGPSRVRGGPGTGKTVAALHRARFLVREGFAESVLMTTFVRVLPATWRSLLQSFAPAEAGSIQTSTVDALAHAIAGGQVRLLADDQERLPLAEKAVRATGLARTAAWLLGEIDTVIAGRGLSTPAEYAAVARAGRGTALGQIERAAVFRAYEHYAGALVRERATDFPHLRLRALQLAEAGAGPRFDAIIADEAQDLSLVHVKLLLALDRHADHRAVMLAGDGQQSVYPGGFSLRAAGLDVRGRSFLLKTNWRNTQRIADAARLALGDQVVGDLEEDDGSSPDAAPPRRLGTPPELHLVAGPGEARHTLTDLLLDALAAQEPTAIAVLARSKKLLGQIVEPACSSAGCPIVRVADLARADPAARSGCVRVGTFEYAKGLEFKTVILVGPAARDWEVTPYWLRDPADRAEWFLRERRKLFVAMTRARDRLALVASPPLHGPLQEAAPACEELDWR